MPQLRLTSSRAGFALAVSVCATLGTRAVAGSGNLPGTGPVITGAQLSTAIPVPISGDTSDNSDDFDAGPLTNPPTDCAASTAPDAWYTISIGTATGTLAIDIDLCADENGQPLNGTLYDSKIFVLDPAMNPIACSDETGCSSGAGPSAIFSLVLAPGVYELAIDGFASDAGPYVGQVRSFIPLPPCVLDPPCTGPDEGEPCDEVNPDTTGCCNCTGDLFVPAPIGTAVCGTNWASNGTRDTDWWGFEITETGAFELELRAETNSVSFLAQLSDGGTCPVAGIPDGIPAYSGDCDAVHIIGTGYLLDPGWYIMFVGTGTPSGDGLFDGFPCPAGGPTTNAYELEIRSVPLPPPPCPWDLNENNDIDFADILQVIANWGPCPTGGTLCD